MLRRADHPDDFAGLQGLREAIAAGIDNATLDYWGSNQRHQVRSCHWRPVRGDGVDARGDAGDAEWSRC